MSQDLMGWRLLQV